MWIVVHFLNEDPVEAVPEIWYQRKDKTCAWPLLSKTSKKCIERKDYPNHSNYEWLPARSLGRKYATLEEARQKSNRAQYLTDLSENDDTMYKQSTSRKNMESPSLIPSKVQKIDQNALPNYKINDQYEPDKDPGFHQQIILDTSPISKNNKDIFENDTYILNSVREKKCVEKVDVSSNDKTWKTSSSVRKVLFQTSEHFAGGSEASPISKNYKQITGNQGRIGMV